MGRHKRLDGQTWNVGTVLTVSVYLAAEKLALASGETMSAWVREAVRQRIERDTL